jgi:hypothetical protein
MDNEDEPEEGAVTNDEILPREYSNSAMTKYGSTQGGTKNAIEKNSS